MGDRLDIKTLRIALGMSPYGGLTANGWRRVTDLAAALVADGIRVNVYQIPRAYHDHLRQTIWELGQQGLRYPRRAVDVMALRRALERQRRGEEMTFGRSYERAEARHQAQRRLFTESDDGEDDNDVY